MEQQLLTSEAADAEGMLLLKVPHDMLATLEHVVPEDNFVPTAGSALAPLFFCWAGAAYISYEDPEMRRVARLRETLVRRASRHRAGRRPAPSGAPRTGRSGVDSPAKP
jgi:hypothetical protein